MDIADHHKMLLRHLVQSEAWKVVMHVIGERLTHMEMTIRQFSIDRDMRLQYMERRNELLDLVGRVYQHAGEDNPYDIAAHTLWATTMKLPLAEPYQEEAERMLAAAGIHPPKRRGEAGRIA